MQLLPMIQGIKVLDPDKTFYETIKGVSLFEQPITNLSPSTIPIPASLNLPQVLTNSWTYQHVPLIEKAFSDISSAYPYRTVFPGPYIPSLNGEMKSIGDFSYAIFEQIIKTVKQRIPDPKKIIKNSTHYTYKQNYKPIIKKIHEPEEAWFYTNIPCPSVDGVSFPLPQAFQHSPEDQLKLKQILKLINAVCTEFCEKHVGYNVTRTNKDIRELLSFIDIVQNLFNRPISSTLIRALDEILTYFDTRNQKPSHPAKFLFEIKHTLTYLLKIKDLQVIASCPYATYWVDVIKLPLENLIETELCDIQRVLREIRTFFSLGWSPIVVHIDKELGFNTDGTHRHYALLTIELLRRLKKAHLGIPIRKIDLLNSVSYQTIMTFKERYKKGGLSFRETLRVVNYLVNGDSVWPYLEDLEKELFEIKNLECKYVPVIYLPEWRARSVVKNLCDKGIALVGVPPLNIYFVGRSKGKKGIFIRGGYHGTDRQPLFWLNMVELQKT